MSISAPFIRRPVGTTLLTVALALAGGMATAAAGLAAAAGGFPDHQVSRGPARRQPGDHGLLGAPRRSSASSAASPASPR
jgi:hypothetical protein